MCCKLNARYLFQERDINVEILVKKKLSFVFREISVYLCQSANIKFETTISLQFLFFKFKGNFVVEFTKCCLHIALFVNVDHIFFSFSGCGYVLCAW